MDISWLQGMLFIFIIIIIFTYKNKPYQLESFAQDKKYFLVFHTVCILDENIQWLEEFIQYYLCIGFEHFYLYDNTGSIGRDESTQTKNKYGFDITKFTKESDTILQHINTTYGDYITWIKWHPTDDDNNIIYGYNESIEHFIKTYGNQVEWCAFLDLDEFLFSPNHINIPNYLREKQEDDVGNVMILQKKFKDRFLMDRPYVRNNYDCINGIDTSAWAPKCIIHLDKYRDMEHMHAIYVTNKTITEDINILRFNHYNVNDKLLEWMKGFYNTDTDYELNSSDNGMNYYKHCFT